jgi:hypothetical protein
MNLAAAHRLADSDRSPEDRELFPVSPALFRVIRACFPAGREVLLGFAAARPELLAAYPAMSVFHQEYPRARRLS